MWPCSMARLCSRVASPGGSAPWPGVPLLAPVTPPPPAAARRPGAARRAALVPHGRRRAGCRHAGLVGPAPRAPAPAAARRPGQALPRRRHVGRLLRLRARAPWRGRGRRRRPGGPVGHRLAARGAGRPRLRPDPQRRAAAARRLPPPAPRSSTRGSSGGAAASTTSTPPSSARSTSSSSAASSCTCATRSVPSTRCGGWSPRVGSFLSIEYIHPPVNVLGRGRPLFELRGETSDFQWWLASDRGLQQLLKVAGFDIDRMSPYFLLRPGDALPAAHAAHDHQARPREPGAQLPVDARRAPWAVTCTAPT